MDYECWHMASVLLFPETVQNDLRNTRISISLSCFLCSPLLEDLCLDMFATHRCEDYRMGPVLAGLPALPSIKSVEPRNIEAEEAHLVKFCNGLGAIGW